MTKSKALIFASALLCIGGSAQAYTLGNWDLSGSIMLEGQVVSGDNEDHAQFNKFTDIKDGVTGGFSLSGYNADYGMELRASDIGRDTQEFRLSGGRFESFGYELFYNEIINNRALFDGAVKGPWDGAGTATLTPVPGIDLSAANTTGEGFKPFDFSINRKIFGGSLDLLKGSPFFAKIGYNRENQEGLRALGMAPTFSTSSTIFEMPEPIDYVTDNVNASVGYRSDAMAVSLEGFFSSFNNNNEKLIWTPANTDARNASGLKDTTLLAQDGDFWNLNFRDTIYDLPLDSTFTAKLGYSRITSKFDVLNSANTPDLLHSAGTTSAAAVNYATISTVVTDVPAFDGKIDYASADFALASQPTDNLDTKLFYGYLNKKNKSNQVTYSGFPTVTLRPGVTGSYNATSGIFSYFKHHAGADAQYKLPADTKFGVGYDFLHVNRTEGRPTNPENTDHKATLSLSNNSLDWLTSRIRYSYLARLADYRDEEGFLFFDAAEKRMNTLAVEFEAMPLEGLDAGLSASYSYAKYLDSVAGELAGRLNDHDLIVGANLGYQFGDAMHLGIYGELDRYTSETEIHAPSEFAYNYYIVGTNLTMPIIRNIIDFRAGYQYQRGRGNAEGEEYDNAAGSSSGPLYKDGVLVTANTPGLAGAINYLDTYTRHTASAQVSYKVLENLAAKLGYTFSQLDYLDDRIAGYSYNNTNPDSAVWTQSGATLDWDYKAHVAFIGAEYTF
ncbi:MAG: hypothetical protein A2X94_00140 [Bdellovibrionales bacterium GWB1_55_8]|nr:MAG: hypothetical protein A2X94_00140 [Bdellovibrionales bacterium GWB1_55_8]